MIVVGAMGLAKEILEICLKNGQTKNLYFFDNITPDVAPRLYDRFDIIRSFEDVGRVFKSTNDESFSLGLGGPIRRYRMNNVFLKIGGKLTSVISTEARIGHFNMIEAGACILPGAVVTTNVRIGRGCLLNPNVTISHDSVLGEFVELGPGVNVTGNCAIGDFTSLGANAVVLPNIRIGANVVVGAGAVVTKDIPDNCLAVGVPAAVKRILPPADFQA